MKLSLTVNVRNGLTHICLRHPFYGTSANNAEPDQTSQFAAFDQVLHCLLTECSIRIQMKSTIQQPLNGNGLVHLIKSGKFHLT